MPIVDLVIRLISVVIIMHQFHRLNCYVDPTVTISPRQVCEDMVTSLVEDTSVYCMVLMLNMERSQ